MSYIGAEPGVSSQRQITREIVAVASKTAFVPTNGYSIGYVDVYVNGLQLDDTDFTAPDGVNITLATAALLGDLVRIVAWLPRGLSDGYLKSEADARFLKVDGTNYVTGNLGVGTGSPLAKINAAGAAGSNMVQSNDTNSTGTFLRMYGDVTNGSVINVKTGDVIRFAHSAQDFGGFTERMRIDSSGNVGIGVTAPSKKLELGSLGALRLQTGSVTMDCTPTAGATDGFVWNVSAGYYDWSIGGASKMRLDSSGNLFIGASGTYQRSWVNNTYYQAVTNTGASVQLVFHRGANNGWAIGADSDGTFNFIPATYATGAIGTVAMRLDSSGNFMVGTSSQLASSRMSVQSTGLTAAAAFWMTGTPGTTSYNCVWFGSTGNGAAGAVLANQNSISLGSVSDYRQKTNVEPLGNAIDRLMQLAPKRFNWANIEEQHDKIDGFIAHEVQAVIPEAVFGEKDAVYADGKPHYQMMDASKIVPLLTAALQEQQALIAQLLADVKTLKEAA